MSRRRGQLRWKDVLIYSTQLRLRLTPKDKIDKNIATYSPTDRCLRLATLLTSLTLGSQSLTMNKSQVNDSLLSYKIKLPIYEVSHGRSVFIRGAGKASDIFKPSKKKYQNPEHGSSDSLINIIVKMKQLPNMVSRDSTNLHPGEENTASTTAPSDM